MELLGVSAAADKETVGIVPFGQFHRERLASLCPQTLRDLSGSVLPTAVTVGIKGQIHNPCDAVAQLVNLRRIQVDPHRTGDVGKARLPQHSQIEQSLDQNDLRTRPYFLPAVEPSFASGQKLVWRGLTDAAPIEIAVQRKHDAMGKSIEAFQRDYAGLLKVWERVTQTHQPGAQTSTGRIADAQLLDQLRLA